MILSHQLKQYRLEHGFTQERLAELCGVSRQAVAKWESGTSIPEIDNLLRLSELFHISLEMLLTGNDTIHPPEPHLMSDAHAANEKLINKGLQQAMACDDPHEEIRMFIGYLGRMMSCDRTYIFEQDPCGDYCNSYEWCNRGVIPQINLLQGIPAADLSSWLEAFHRNDYVFIEDIETLREIDPSVYEWLAPQQIRTLLVYPLFGGKAFFGVDNPAMAFVSQTAALMELVTHFLETMLQRRDLVQNLLIEIDRNRDIDKTAHRAQYYVNLKTGSIAIDMSAIRSLGYDFTFRSMDELFELLERHPECRRHILEDGLKKVEATKKAITLEFVFYTDSHLIRWARLSIRPFLDSRGDLLQLYGTLQDVSDEHEIIERYNAFTTRLRGGMHIYILSAPFRLSFASDNLCDLVGYTRKEFEVLFGDNYELIVLDEDRAAFKGFVQRLAEHPGTIETCEYGLRHRDGSVVRVIDTMESVLDGNGIVYGYANVMDVSELRRSIDLAKEHELHRLAELDRQFEIADALSRDYLNIFFVDLEREEAFIHKLNGYVTRGMDRDSIAPIPYYDYCRRYIRDRVHPDDRAMMAEAMHPDTVRQKLAACSEYISSYRILVDGETHHCQFKYIIPEAEEKNAGLPAKVIAAFKNIDAVVQRELESKKALHRRMDIINAFLKIYSVGCYVNLEDSTVTGLSFGQETVESLSGDGAVSQAENITLGTGEGDGKTLCDLYPPDSVRSRLSETEYASEQIQLGRGTWYEVSLIAGDRGQDGELKQYFIMARDISAEKQREFARQKELRLSRRREQEAMKTAYQDVLTGVMNRTAFERDFQMLDRTKPVGIIYCDVNNLKITNDTLGHRAGDALLCRFTELMKRHFSADCIYRIGGDEFVCVIGNIGRERFLARTEALSADIRASDGIASVGTAHGQASEKDSLLLSAEQRMYQDKMKWKQAAGRMRKPLPGA